MKIHPLLFVMVFLIGLLSTQRVVARGQPMALSFSKQVLSTLYHIHHNPRISYNAQALEAFRKQMNFEKFSGRVFQDFREQLSLEEKQTIQQALEELFIENIKMNGEKFRSRSFKNPRLTLQKHDRDQAIVHIREGNITKTSHQGPQVHFYLSRHVKQWTLVDLSVDNVLLSRNYRGPLNKIFRLQGYQGLLTYLEKKKRDLQNK